MADVLVIGAGISGLAAAHRLRTQGVDVHLFERASVAGGYVRTITRGSWRYEWGPNSFLGSADALRNLAQEVGLTPIAARPVASKRFLFLDGKLQALPSSPLSAIATRSLSVAAKLRLLSEPFRRNIPTETQSVRAFFEHHLGPEPTDRFVDAFVSGIHAGNISEMSIAATFPRLYELARSHGSLIRGFKAQSRSEPRRSTPRGTFSFSGGLGDLPAALAAGLGDRLHLEHDVRIAREGSSWHVGEWSAPAIIFATPAPVTAQLVEASPLSDALKRVRYSAMAGVHLLLRREDVLHPLNGFGFLIPRRGRRSGCWAVSGVRRSSMSARLITSR